MNAYAVMHNEKGSNFLSLLNIMVYRDCESECYGNSMAQTPTMTIKGVGIGMTQGCGFNLHQVPRDVSS